MPKLSGRTTTIASDHVRQPSTGQPGADHLIESPGLDHVVVGISGVRQNASAAVCVNGELRAFCEQERLTRVRRASLQPGSLPTEALDAVLRLAGGYQPSDVHAYVTAEEDAALPATLSSTRVGHHFAHAATAFYSSPFDRAVVVICDHRSTERLSVWTGTREGLAAYSWPFSATGFAGLYSACCALFGFMDGQEHQLEALARLDAGSEADRFNGLIGYADGVLWASPRWQSTVADWLSEEVADPLRHRARIASAFQRHLGRLLLALVCDVRTSTNVSNLCLGGGLFYNTYFNALISQSGLFEQTFIAPNPGNAGLSAGAALAVRNGRPARTDATVSPFLGPQYDLEEIKPILDNCKLSYECLNEGDVITSTVDALRRGRLVAWFQGRMEWGHRALGNRSILASPLSEYVLDNLNVFLKRRQRHRAYGLSVAEADAPRYFVGPQTSRFMEYDYQLVDPDLLRHVTPPGATTLRVQTVAGGALEPSRRFERLHQAFGDATGVPVLVNTSFNGFSEPIVCSPRDAVRVFFGTGLDMLVLDRFVIRK